MFDKTSKVFILNCTCVVAGSDVDDDDGDINIVLIIAVCCGVGAVLLVIIIVIIVICAIKRRKCLPNIQRCKQDQILKTKTKTTGSKQRYLADLTYK